MSIQDAVKSETNFDAEPALQTGDWYAQLAIDLATAYLADYGTRRDLARALDVKESFVTYILPKPTGYSKRLIPTEARARQVADELCTDRERRDALLDFWVRARTAHQEPAVREEALNHEEVEQLLARFAELHSWTYRADPIKAGFAYLKLHRDGWASLERVSPKTSPLARVQVLPYLHDVDSVLNRPDLALKAAREARLVLQEAQPHPRDVDRYHRLEVNVYRAEAVALNNLRRPIEARAVTTQAQELPGATTSTGKAFWTPLVLGDHLSSLRRMRRFAVSEPLELHDQALRFADNFTRVLLDNRLADALVVHGSRRSLGKARDIVDAQLARLEDGLQLPPLHRAMTLRTGVRFATAAREDARRDQLLSQCLTVVTDAGLVHQLDDMRREFGDVVVDRSLEDRRGAGSSSDEARQSKPI